jgi:N-methylhydantoinase B/oxoprolinase/acetone carboxylase alpha subunit
MPKGRRGIGKDGVPLRAMLEKSERLFAESGRYFRLDRLELKESDPIRYEKIFSRLRGGLVNARETAMNVSASPIVKEIGELCFALYTPEGDSVALSTGIIVHVHTMSDAIKYMIRNDYEENPGIEPGDIFANNDPFIGDVHNGDVQTLVPIFSEGEIVGWAGGVTHEIDIGALTPGSVPVGPTNRLEDGIDLPAVKCGAKDTLFRDHVNRCAKATRTPMYWHLDERARVAGCHMIRKAVHELIREEGVETYMRFIREVIEEGRRTFIERIRELTVPGRYRAPAFTEYSFAREERFPHYARVDHMMHAPMEIRISGDGVFHLSFEGASKWGWHSMNCTPSAMQGAVWVLLSQLIFYNDKVNDGAYLATRSHFPRGSWTNPDNEMVGTGVAWYFLIPGFTGMFRLLGRAFQARGYVEEVLSSYGITGNCFQGGGIDIFGKESATTNFEMSCVGTGGGVVRDGLDFAAAMWNPEGDMGDPEVWELIEPFIYLGRSIKPCTAGPGKYRGGSGYEALRMCWKTPYYQLQNISSGKVFPSPGIFGGYPPSTSYRKNLFGTNILEIARQKRPYPLADGVPAESGMDRTLECERTVFDKTTVTLPEPFHQGDLYLSILMGGAGCGDVLERDPARVEEDLNGGFLTEEYARRIYGAHVEEQNGRFRVDPEKTKALRREAYALRKERARPVRQWIEKERERVRTGDFIGPICNMVRQSMDLSEAFAAEMRAFWGLDEDWGMPLEKCTAAKGGA